MPSDKIPEVNETAIHPVAQHPVERNKFKSLLLANPNHFGNLQNWDSKW